MQTVREMMLFAKTLKPYRLMLVCLTTLVHVKDNETFEEEIWVVLRKRVPEAVCVEFVGREKGGSGVNVYYNEVQQDGSIVEKMEVIQPDPPSKVDAAGRPARVDIVAKGIGFADEKFGEGVRYIFTASAPACPALPGVTNFLVCLYARTGL